MVKWLGAMAAVSLLVGCGSLPEIPFDKTANANVHTIGVVTPSMPQRPNIWLASDMGQSFGLIGALIDASMQESRNGKVWAMLESRNVNPRDNFVKAIQASLKAAGYDAKFVEVPRKEGEALKTYPSESGVDAYLDITGMNYGYVAAGIGKSTPYRPFVYLTCKLVRASDGAVLMQDSIFYDPVAPFGQGKNVVSISPDPAYTFVDFDTMQSQPDQVVLGIDASMHQTTDALGRLLR
jgi:hypothetical protein